MKLKPIKTKKEHHAALCRIEDLMDKKKKTAAEYAELEQLVTLVDIYEEKHFPIMSPN